MTERVILVDEFDRQIGTEEKIKAHQQGQLHRAFSVLLLAKEQNSIWTLLQRRHQAKYHCGGLWSNTCCSHPRENETVLGAANRRLDEEMGVSAKLSPVGNFIYKANFSNGLCEHEFDYVLTGVVSKTIIVNPNPDEVMDYKWVDCDELKQLMQASPDTYTPWFAQALHIASESLRK